MADASEYIMDDDSSSEKDTTPFSALPEAGLDAESVDAVIPYTGTFFVFSAQLPFVVTTHYCDLFFDVADNEFWKQSRRSDFDCSQCCAYYRLLHVWLPSLMCDCNMSDNRFLQT